MKYEISINELHSPVVLMYLVYKTFVFQYIYWLILSSLNLML